MDESQFDIYGDLEDFDLKEQIKNKETAFKCLEEKYQFSLKKIDNLQTENDELKKKINNMNKSFSSLLLTAKSEISRKDHQINDLRREKDDIAFRRFKKTHESTPSTSYQQQTQQEHIEFKNDKSSVWSHVSKKAQISSEKLKKNEHSSRTKLNIEQKRNIQSDIDVKNHEKHSKNSKSSEESCMSQKTKNSSEKFTKNEHDSRTKLSTEQKRSFRNEIDVKKSEKHKRPISNEHDESNKKRQKLDPNPDEIKKKFDNKHNKTESKKKNDNITNTSNSNKKQKNEVNIRNNLSNKLQIEKDFLPDLKNSLNPNENTSINETKKKLFVQTTEKKDEDIIFDELFNELSNFTKQNYNKTENKLIKNEKKSHEQGSVMLGNKTKSFGDIQPLDKTDTTMGNTTKSVETSLAKQLKTTNKENQENKRNHTEIIEELSTFLCLEGSENPTNQQGQLSINQNNILGNCRTETNVSTHDEKENLKDKYPENIEKNTLDYETNISPSKEIALVNDLTEKQKSQSSKNCASDADRSYEMYLATPPDFIPTLTPINNTTNQPRPAQKELNFSSIIIENFSNDIEIKKRKISPPKKSQTIGKNNKLTGHKIEGFEPGRANKTSSIEASKLKKALFEDVLKPMESIPQNNENDDNLKFSKYKKKTNENIKNSNDSTPSENSNASVNTIDKSEINKNDLSGKNEDENLNNDEKSENANLIETITEINPENQEKFDSPTANELNSESSRSSSSSSSSSTTSSSSSSSTSTSSSSTSTTSTEAVKHENEHNKPQTNNIVNEKQEEIIESTRSPSPPKFITKKRRALLEKLNTENNLNENHLKKIKVLNEVIINQTAKDSDQNEKIYISNDENVKKIKFDCDTKEIIETNNIPKRCLRSRSRTISDNKLMDERKNIIKTNKNDGFEKLLNESKNDDELYDTVFTTPKKNYIKDNNNEMNESNDSINEKFNEVENNIKNMFEQKSNENENSGENDESLLEILSTEATKRLEMEAEMLYNKTNKNNGYIEENLNESHEVLTNQQNSTVNKNETNSLLNSSIGEKVNISTSSTDYIIETVSSNVVNVFITRKKRKKRKE